MLMCRVYFSPPVPSDSRSPPFFFLTKSMYIISFVDTVIINFVVLCRYHFIDSHTFLKCLFYSTLVLTVIAIINKLAKCWF
jgi:hypothetical protein